MIDLNQIDLLLNENKQDQISHLRLFQNDYLLLIIQQIILPNDNAKNKFLFNYHLCFYILLEHNDEDLRHHNFE